MVRVVLYIFLAIILISILRAVIGVIGKGFAALMEPEEKRGSGEVQTAGELKRDPVCGTYVSTAISVKKTIAGKTVHFCSQECSEKFGKRA